MWEWSERTRSPHQGSKVYSVDLALVRCFSFFFFLFFKHSRILATVVPSLSRTTSAWQEGEYWFGGCITEAVTTHREGLEGRGGKGRGGGAHAVRILTAHRRTSQLPLPDTNYRYIPERLSSHFSCFITSVSHATPITMAVYRIETEACVDGRRCHSGIFS